jgi:UDP-glucose 4-epimerase
VRAVVTGATGFVGRALVAELRRQDWFVHALSRSGAATPANSASTVDLAAEDLDSGLFGGADVVFHLAAKTHDMSHAAGVEQEYERVNRIGTTRVVQAACRAKVRRLVFVSSVKAIDEGNVEPATELTPERPLTPYGRSKLEAEQIVRAECGAAGVEHVCLRFPLVYGPGQRGNLQRMIAAIARGRFPPPPENGNRRSMLHVENAVQALMLAATHHGAAGKTYIVTDARPYATRDIVNGARAALGRPPLRWYVPFGVFRAAAVVGDVARVVAGRRIGFDSTALQKLLGSATYDTEAIMRELGYRPSRDLLESLPELIAHAGLTS